jgi:hypothetical protein
VASDHDESTEATRAILERTAIILAARSDPNATVLTWAGACLVKDDRLEQKHRSGETLRGYNTFALVVKSRTAVDPRPDARQHPGKPLTTGRTLDNQRSGRVDHSLDIDHSRFKTRVTPIMVTQAVLEVFTSVS